MRKLISTFVALSIVLTLCFSGFHTTAQSQKDQAKPSVIPDGLIKNWDKLPARAKQSLTAEAKAGWEKFTPKQQEKIKAKLLEIFRKEAATLSGTNGLNAESDSRPVTLSYIDRNGQHQTIKARQSSAKTSKSGAALRTKSGRQAIWETDWAAAKTIARTKLHHATKRSRSMSLSPQTGCLKGPEEFVRKFFEGAFVRPPHADEFSYWMNAIAQAQSQGNWLSTAQNFGYSLFQSQEYAARGRSNSEFVYDCYKAFLQREPDQSGWDFWTAQANQWGQAAVLPAFGLSIEFNDDVNAVCSVATFDSDQDGLPDNFENNVADNFTPYYHVSQFEPDNYATFLDLIPQTVKQRFGHTPVSHFRVVPLSGAAGPIRYNNIAGRYESFLRIDYWTLWDHDSGLVGDLCGLAPGEDILEGSHAHDIDNERSALLVSAPAVWNGSGFSINLDPNAYSSLSLYTAAHESTPLAHNFYSDFPENPRQAGNRFELWQSLSKHGTYSFNPDFFPLLQEWMMVPIFTVVEVWIATRACYGDLDMFWIEMFGDDAFGWSCEVWWTVFVSVTYYMTILFFTCIVERFNEQGSQLANIRINLGEPSRPGFPGNPINGSSFINEDDSHTGHIFTKLVEPLNFESLF